ncbi:MAG TPA: aspartate-semialdehyde dehydrogenase [Methylomirabilota bacterium]|jgi:aspartate-semialdehyde dehydrogenase|nr:aspartate-semialdehyde dehydrogenase [Methylomirabilota bacterium]
MKKRVAIVGATGIAGQQFVVALRDHPWFEVNLLAASERSAGKSYAEALRDPKTGARRWWCQEEPSAQALSLPVYEASSLNLSGIDLVFSAVESEPARELEPLYAKTTPVVSTASAFRYEQDVPIFIPGVNLDHIRLLDVQKKNRGWKGFIATQPNCTTIGLAITLKPLFDSFGVKRVIMTSMQGVSGAGRSPGVIALDILDNIIPFISGEEEKVEKESRKILGTLGEGSIVPADFIVSATCTRAAVLEGHTEAVVVSMATPCSVDDARAAMIEFGREFVNLGLPSAPQHMIIVHDDPFRPQPRLDRDAEDGMATSVGRLRKDYALDNGVKYLLVSHNTKMGAAKGAVLTAEYLLQNGYV